MPIIKESLKRLWNADEMRILVLVSLSLQFGLVFLSPLRKRTGQKLLKLLLWFFYLSADYVAILAIGNLLRRQNVGISYGHGGIGLMAIWGPFLLLHLGGPDTITSYSIEDNELWWRHFLGLVVQVVVTFLVLLELVVIPRLRVAAALVFIAGLVKYSERTWALRSSSMEQLRSSMLKHESIRNTGYFTTSDVPLSSDISIAYDLFKRTMPLLVDLKLISHNLYNCHTYFRDCTLSNAFKLVDVELSFLYDVLHTKAILINGPCGFLWRFVSVGMIFSAFVLFLKSEKRGYPKADIIISYVLFGSALFMELISLLLIIFSDWMIVALEETKHSLLKNLAVIIAKVMSCFFSESKPRWSKSMGQYSLLSVSMRDTNTTITRILGAVKLKNLWDKFIFIHSVPVPRELEQLLWDRRGVATLDFQKVKDWKGDRVLVEEGCDHLKWTTQKEFEESILIWHIATDLCFHTHDAMTENHTHSEIRETSLIISNYMLYLLIMQPSMMPDGIGKIRFQKTCETVKEYYDKKRSRLTEEKAREALLNENIPEYGWSVLSDASRLAKELNGLLEEDRRWRVIGRVWVEMLCHAAINCKTYYHAKQLSQGGEFLTHVYVLMCHMLPYDRSAARGIPRSLDLQSAARGIPRSPDLQSAARGILRSPDLQSAARDILRSPDLQSAARGIPRSPDLQSAARGILRSPNLQSAARDILRSPDLQSAARGIPRSPDLQSAARDILRSLYLQSAARGIPRSPDLQSAARDIPRHTYG